MVARLSDREYNRLMDDDKVRQAMRFRCEESGHDMEGACTFTFQIYQQCKWCGERR